MKLIFDEEDTNIPLEIQKRWEVEDFNVVEWSKSIPITSHLSPNSSITVKEVNTDGHLSLQLQLNYRRTVGEIQGE